MGKKEEKAKIKKELDTWKETPEQRRKRINEQGSSLVTKVIPDKRKTMLRKIKEAEAKRNRDSD